MKYHKEATILIATIVFLFFKSLSIAGPYCRLESGVNTFNTSVRFTEVSMGWKLTLFGINSRTYGGWLTWQESTGRSNPLYGSPFMDIYILGEELKYKGFILHFKHYCAHTVNSTYKIQNDRNGNVLYQEWKATPYWWAGNMETLSVGYEFELKD